MKQLIMAKELKNTVDKYFLHIDKLIILLKSRYFFLKNNMNN